MSINRRSFLEQGLTALAGFMILPGAGRIWKAKKEPLYRCIMLPPSPETTLFSETVEYGYYVDLIESFDDKGGSEPLFQRVTLNSVRRVKPLR